MITISSLDLLLIVANQCIFGNHQSFGSSIEVFDFVFQLISTIALQFVVLHQFYPFVLTILKFIILEVNSVISVNSTLLQVILQFYFELMLRFLFLFVEDQFGFLDLQFVFALLKNHFIFQFSFIVQLSLRFVCLKVHFDFKNHFSHVLTIPLLLS